MTQTRSKEGSYQTILARPVKEGPRAGWQHVAGVWDGKKLLRMYVNGVVAGQQHPARHGFTKAMDCQQATPECMEGLQVGGFHLHGGYSSQYFKGLIDEVRVWAVARSAADLSASMHRGLGGHEAGLLYYFRFDEGTGPVTASAGDCVCALRGRATVFHPPVISGACVCAI